MTFSPGSASLSIRLNIQDDSLIEPAETFALRLFPSGQEDPLIVFSPAVTLISVADNDRKYFYMGHLVLHCYCGLLYIQGAPFLLSL